jgi:predicted nucleic acid-binding protein
VKAFFDTNILVYGQQLGRKAEIARRLMSSGGTISVQVLNEFTSVARRKLGYDWSEIAEAVADALAVFVPPVPLTTDTHAAAMDLARDHGLAFYDALIVASAIAAG